MTQIEKAFVGARIHDGFTLHSSHALCLNTDGTRTITPRTDVRPNTPTTDLEGGFIAPAFVDLQLNGGGGVMFNDDPSLATLRTIAAAHASIGTGAILPTLITDTPAQTKAAIDAVEQANDAGIEGIVGLHLEGPHLSRARKGAHDPALIRPMDTDDLTLLLDAAKRLPNLMVTLAPENATNAQISALADAGVIVTLGHTDADIETCMAAFDAGARGVTHLFNAMSQLGSRTPGLVGATLAREGIFAGLIADGIHVHPATMQVALNATPPDKILLVSDAMATAGSSIDHFTLNGRTITRANGQLTLEDGTLAGADLTLLQAVATLVNDCGSDLQTTIARATGLPYARLAAPQAAPLLDPTLFVNHIADDLSGLLRLT